ncbi:MAG TPA: RidA family protein [Gaiellaceae bacterium]|jgi:enamine deaminase RidA (YjgF/YER057c/UK114 family)
MTAEHRIVDVPGLPEPVGYAHAVVAAPGRTVYLGGQIGAGETVVEQFDAAAANMVAALRAAGGEPDDLVSLVVYATDLDEYRASLSDLGDVWRRQFGRRYPAMALVGVSALLDPMARVELMGVAVVPDD